VRSAVRAAGRIRVCLLSVVGVVAACGSTASTAGAPQPPAAASASLTAGLPRPCSFLTRTVAAGISGDTKVSNQAADVLETESGYVACIFADTADEANNVAVQVRSVPGGAVGLSTLRDAATFFSLGEPVQPFQPFAVPGIGDRALGEATAGVAFVVFSRGDLVIYVGAGSATVGGAALRAGVANLAQQIAAAV
jgi:hypothetical protein